MGIRRLVAVCFRCIFSAARGMVDLGDDCRVYLWVLERVGALQVGEVHADLYIGGSSTPLRRSWARHARLSSPGRFFPSSFKD